MLIRTLVGYGVALTIATCGAIWLFWPRRLLAIIPSRSIPRAYARYNNGKKNNQADQSE